MGPIGRGCLRGSLGFSRLGCRQLGRRDAQQLAELFGIVPSTGRYEHLRFSAWIWRRFRHRFGVCASRYRRLNEKLIVANNRLCVAALPSVYRNRRASPRAMDRRWRASPTTANERPISEKVEVPLNGRSWANPAFHVLPAGQQSTLPRLRPPPAVPSRWDRQRRATHLASASRATVPPPARGRIVVPTVCWLRLFPLSLNR